MIDLQPQRRGALLPLLEQHGRLLSGAAVEAGAQVDEELGQALESLLEDLESDDLELGAETGLPDVHADEVHDEFKLAATFDGSMNLLDVFGPDRLVAAIQNQLQALQVSGSVDEGVECPVVAIYRADEPNAILFRICVSHARFLHLLRPVMCVLPEVAQPERRVPFREKVACALRLVPPSRLARMVAAEGCAWALDAAFAWAPALALVPPAYWLARSSTTTSTTVESESQPASIGGGGVGGGGGEEGGGGLTYAGFHLATTLPALLLLVAWARRRSPARARIAIAIGHRYAPSGLH